MSDNCIYRDAALLALDGKLFGGHQTLTDNDLLLIKVVSRWDQVERRNSLAALIKVYEMRGLGAQVVDALARVICRDVEIRLGYIAKGVGKRPAGGSRLSLLGGWRRWLR